MVNDSPSKQSLARVVRRMLPLVAATLSGCMSVTTLGLPESQVAQLRAVENVDKVIVGNSVMFASRIGQQTQWGAMVPYPTVHAVYFGPGGQASYPHKPNARYTVSKNGFCFLRCFTVFELDGEYIIRDEDGHHERMLVEPGLGEVSARARRENRQSLSSVLANVQMVNSFFTEMARIESLKCVQRSSVLGCVEYSDGSTPFSPQ